MKNWKRYMLVFIGIMLLFGCGYPKRKLQKENKKKTVSDYTELTMFSDVSYWELPEWSLDEGSVTGEITKRTGVIIDDIVPPKDADRQLSLLLLKDELPDLISITDETMISQLIDSGKVWRMDELLETYCPKSHLLTSFPEDIKNRLIDFYGGWYSYPSNMNSADAREIWKEKTDYYENLFYSRENTAVMWNLEIMEMAGLTQEDLQTKSQVLAAFEKIKNMELTVHGQKVVPLLLDGNNYDSFSLLYLNNSFGAEQIDEEGNYMDRWRQPQGKETLKFVNTALREGYAYTQHLSYDNAQIRTLIDKDCVFCFIGNTANTGMDAREWISTGVIDSETESKPVLGIDLTPKGWMHTFVSKSCKNPEAAAFFLDYMTSNEGLLFTNFGVEGQDFYYDDDGYVRRTEAGEQRYEQKRVTGLGIWWNFTIDAWYNSVIPIPAEESQEKSCYDIQTALGKESYVYDMGLLSISRQFWEENPKEAEIKSTVEAYQKKQILRIITAESEEEFQREYEKLLQRQGELGIVQLDEKINEQVQKNFETYEKRIDKVN